MDKSHDRELPVRPGQPNAVSPSYQEVLNFDTFVPDYLRAESAPFLGDEPVDTSCFTSHEFFEKEVEKLWPRIWQYACREEEVPNVGDYVVYDIARYSLLITRTAEDKIQAFHNVCLHRGRKLCLENGHAQRFRCPFHGFTWGVNGEFRGTPANWDFSSLTKEDYKLPEAKVEVWAGYVFINMDDNAPPLHEVLGILPEHFERYDHAKRYKAVHVAKVVRANWKVVAEAFMESWHTVDTHPQIMPYLACVNSQYDVYSDYISRQISAQGIASPHIAGKITEQEIVDAMLPMSRVSSGIDSMTVPEGGSARKIVAQLRRENMSRDHGRDYSHAGEAEMMDAILYNVFPNFSVWGGFPTNLVYRWRPNGMDPNSAIMEAMYMAPIPEGQPRPDPAPCHWVSEEGGWKEAEELGGLADVFVQDEGNLPYVQEGLNASWNKKVIFSNYNEMRIRQMHITLDKYLNDEV